jgi:hypothetical protein
MIVYCQGTLDTETSYMSCARLYLLTTCFLPVFFLATDCGADSHTRATSFDNNDEIRCADPTLNWKTANKTYYESYPEPGSEECIKYNGCQWEGQFSACEGKKDEKWVEATNIAAVFPLFDELAHHELCIRSGDRVMIVNVIDTCGDADCDGCCTRNQGEADALIDLESYTNARWVLPDSLIEWADLGKRAEAVCD